MNLPLKQLNLAGGDGYIGPSFPLPLQSPSPRKLPLLKFPITKATGAIKWLVKEYTGQNVAPVGCKYPSTIAVEDALSIDSPLWSVLNDDIQPQSAVPYCSKRQLIDLVHTLKRCLEEIASTKEEMARMFSHFEGKLKVLDT